MGRFTMAICLTLISVACKAQDRGYIGADVGACIAERSIRLIVSHSFGDRWTICADSGLTPATPSAIKKNTEDETYIHQSEFEDDTRKNTDKMETTFLKTGISVSFWYKEAYHGGFLNFGVETAGKNAPSCKIGTGYMLHIWKGITAYLMYSISLDTKEVQQLPLKQGISFCIGYVFQ